MNYKIKNFSNYSNKKYSKFTSNFVDDQDFSNFMRGTGQRGTGQRGTGQRGTGQRGTGQRVLRYLT